MTLIGSECENTLVEDDLPKISSSEDFTKPIGYKHSAIPPIHGIERLL